MCVCVCWGVFGVLVGSLQMILVCVYMCGYVVEFWWEIRCMVLVHWNVSLVLCFSFFFF